MRDSVTRGHLCSEISMHTVRLVAVKTQIFEAAVPPVVGAFLHMSLDCH